LGWTGFALALLPTVGVNINPPEVRASGYNLGYSVTAGFVGGLSPMAVTAIRSSGSPSAHKYGSGFWALAAAAVSALAYSATAAKFPVCRAAKARPLEDSELTDADILAILEDTEGPTSKE
jgi:hypothetical protein